MSIKKILVYVDNSPSCTNRIKTAIQLAKSFQAQLTGLYVNDWAQRIMMITPEIVPTVAETQHQLWQQQEAEAKKCFETVSDHEAFQTHWSSHEGDLINTICHYTHTADLVILSSISDNKKHFVQHADISHGVTLGAGCPVMLLPPEVSTPFACNHIMIAWDMSREAAWAVKAALPFLIKADRVEILTLTPLTLPFFEAHNHHEQLLAYLQQHGIQAESHLIDKQKLSVAEALVFHSTDRSIDLIVMGAYGHSRLREVILGGTSKDMLKNPPLSLLMCH